jgi:hypothetical protein
MEGFVRPQAVVLPETALVPPHNLVTPPPNQFTHELVRHEPFYFTPPGAGDARPDGELPVGCGVVLMVYEGGTTCRVVDGRGLYVVIRSDALRRLE